MIRVVLTILTLTLSYIYKQTILEEECVHNGKVKRVALRSSSWSGHLDGRNSPSSCGAVPRTCSSPQRWAVLSPRQSSVFWSQRRTRRLRWKEVEEERRLAIVRPQVREPGDWRDSSGRQTGLRNSEARRSMCLSTIGMRLCRATNMSQPEHSLVLRVCSGRVWCHFAAIRSHVCLVGILLSCPFMDAVCWLKMCLPLYDLNRYVFTLFPQLKGSQTTWSPQVQLTHLTKYTKVSLLSSLPISPSFGHTQLSIWGDTRTVTIFKVQVYRA